MTNSEMTARSLAAVWHPCTQMKRHERLALVPIARASGPWLYDFEGRGYLDAVSSWWVNLFGHAHPAIDRAIREQVGTLEHVMLAGFTHEPAIVLAERLARLAPGGLGHAFFASDGASATEIALKMAFHYWANRARPGKRRFVSLQGGYHGETVGALGVTDVAIFRDTYAPLLRESLVAPFPARDAADHRFGGMQGAIEAARALEALLEAHPGEVAALIVEPLVQGASGMRFYHFSIRRAREPAHHECLVADEIKTGFGRRNVRVQRWQGPDPMCLPGLTGGYLPLSCVLATDEVYGAFYDDDAGRAFLHSHSYTGNALACRAACAVLDLFERDDVIAANERKAARFVAAAAALAHHPGVRDFRHLGMIWAFEVPTGRGDFAERAFELALARGVLLRPIGNTVYFMPPYVVDDAQFAQIVAAGVAIAEALA
jgi:adenosylmethionine-8-amino-7-oxononanoate aminotransferase